MPPLGAVRALLPERPFVPERPLLRAPLGKSELVGEGGQGQDGGGVGGAVEGGNAVAIGSHDGGIVGDGHDLVVGEGLAHHGQVVVAAHAAGHHDGTPEALVSHQGGGPAAHLHRLGGGLDHDEHEVEECQTPFFLSTEVGDDGRVAVWFDCPPQAPTTRGFAGILAEGLNGATAEEVLAVPNDFYSQMGLDEAISTLRLRGMGAILGQLKRQVREQTSPVGLPG